MQSYGNSSIVQMTGNCLEESLRDIAVNTHEFRNEDNLLNSMKKIEVNLLLFVLLIFCLKSSYPAQVCFGSWRMRIVG